MYMVHSYIIPYWNSSSNTIDLSHAEQLNALSQIINSQFTVLCMSMPSPALIATFTIISLLAYIQLTPCTETSLYMCFHVYNNAYIVIHSYT